MRSSIYIINKLSDPAISYFTISLFVTSYYPSLIFPRHLVCPGLKPENDACISKTTISINKNIYCFNRLLSPLKKTI